jgi:hypothetical protein
MPISKKRIKGRRDYRKFSDGKLSVRGHHIYISMSGNTRFPNPTVRLEDFKPRLDRFDALLAECIHGDRRVIAQKNDVREEIINDLDLLLAYVEYIADQDDEAFTSSGFERVPSEFATPERIEKPVVEKIEQGTTGVLLITVSSRGREARFYELRSGAADTDPESWPVMGLASAADPIAIAGLQPGTIYAFQVRARDAVGFTDWSDSATRMCI